MIEERDGEITLRCRSAYNLIALGFRIYHVAADFGSDEEEFKLCKDCAHLNKGFGSYLRVILTLS